MQAYLGRHFDSKGHIGFLESVSITLINRKDGGVSRWESWITEDRLKKD